MRNSVSALLAILLVSILAPLTWCDATPAPAQVPSNGLYFGPCVTQVTGSSAKILWVMTPGTPIDSRVDIAGAKVAMKTQPIPVPDRKETVHVATITGLKPGQAYPYKLTFWQAGVSQGEIAGTFETPPAADSTAPLRFVIYGDTRSYPERHHSVATAIDHEDHLAFVVHSGDYTDYTTIWQLWKQQFFDPAQEMLRHRTFWPCLGNHEEDGAIARAIFDMPSGYYSFDDGNTHIVVLDTELDAKGHQAMLAWLDKDLTASKATWKIVVYHRGTFDIAYHRSSFGQTDLLPILEKCGVDMVLNGHTHNYQRFRPIGTPGKKPIVFVVSAGGGAPSYPIHPSPILEKEHFGLNYCVFTVTGNTLEMTAKSPDGTVLDQLKLIKTDGLYQKEIMDRAVSIDFAQNAAFLLSGFFASTDAAFGPGQKVTFHISPLEFPEGATVEISSATVVPPALPGKPKGQWAVTRTTLTGWKGRPGVDEGHSDKKYAPLSFTATAPADFQFSDPTEPIMLVQLRVTYEKQTYTTACTGVYLLTQAWLDYFKERGR